MQTSERSRPRLKPKFPRIKRLLREQQRQAKHKTIFFHPQASKR